MNARGIVSGEAGETRRGSTPQGQEPGDAGTRPEADAQPLRQPLTEAQIKRIRLKLCDYYILSASAAEAVTRAVEAAHGITTRSPKP